MELPIHFSAEEDQLIWNYSSNGEYTVKSAYYHTMENLVDSSHLRVQGDWNSIWQLNVPHKVKSFLWRMMRDCLPTRQRLNSKGVQCTSLCPLCDNCPESAWHVFFGCSKVHTVWRESGCWNTISSTVNTADNLNDCVFKLLKHLSGTQQLQFISALWCLWRRRNEKVWENLEKPAFVSFNQAMEYIYHWRRKAKETHAVAVSHESGATRSAEFQRWTKPQAGMIKCNIDASIFTDSSMHGSGLCIRNDMGEFVLARTLIHDGLPPAHEAEASSLLAAISWIADMSIHNVVFEIDCKQVYDDMLSTPFPTNEFGCILEKCKRKLSSIHNSSLSLVCRP